MEPAGLKAAVAAGERDVEVLALHLAYERLNALIAEAEKGVVSKITLLEARKILPAQYLRSIAHGH